MLYGAIVPQGGIAEVFLGRAAGLGCTLAVLVNNCDSWVKNYFQSGAAQAAAIVQVFVIHKNFFGKFAHLYDRRFGQEHTGAGN